MLNTIVEHSLRHRRVVAGAACMVLAYGVYVAARAKLDVFPEFAPPQVVVHTEAPGLSPEEVEALVTRPVENGVNGVGDLESLRSQSIQGLSVVIAIFKEGTDIQTARQRVIERLVEVTDDLPSGVRTPVLDPLTSSTSLVMVVGLTSASRTLMDVRTWADWTMRPRLLGVPGVAKVVEFGGEVRQLHVEPDPEALAARGLALSEVLDAAREATGVLGAGFVENENQRVAIRTEGQSITAADLAESVVSTKDGAVTRLADVARVVDAPAPPIGDAAVNGEPGVLLQVWSQYGTNTLEVTAAVERALDELSPVLAAEKIDLHSRLFRPATFIETSISNINESLFIGGALVAIVLSLFLFNLRTAFISLTAIPLSLLVAVIILDALGATLNVLTLGGFAIAIGEVVDDAIIDVENIFRRLRENRALGSPRSSFRVVLDASLEVRSSVVYATFVVAIVFLPVLTMSGVQGKLFAPLGYAYILATMASLGVALTVTPALSLLFLGKGSLLEEPGYLRKLKAAHVRGLRFLVEMPGRVIAAVVILCAGAALLVPTFGGEFLPEFQEGHFIIQMSMVPGSSVRESLRLGRTASKELIAGGHVISATTQVGRAELGEDTAGPDFGELIVAVKPAQDEEESAAKRGEIRKKLLDFPGARFAVKPFLEERIEEVISGSRAEVVIRVYGDDLDAIDRVAGDVESVVAGIRGGVDVRFQRSQEPQVVVRLDREKLKLFGLRPREVLEAVSTAYQGTTVAQVHDKSRVFDVVVILEEAARKDPERIQDLLLGSSTGVQVRLGEIADVFLTTGRHTVFHDGARRYQEVDANVEGRDLASFVAEAKARVAREVQFPAGTYPVFSGTGEEQARARREILLHSLLAAAGVVLLMSVVFSSGRNLLLVLSNAPFALVGGILAVFLTEGELSVGSLVGFVTLFGITTRNSIMMVSHFEHLVGVEGQPWSLETALRGASERLVPVLMTALVTALGILPIALGSGEAGREIEGPMAVVILGGLATSTALNLLVLPILALRWGRFGASREPGEPDVTPGSSSP